MSYRRSAHLVEQQMHDLIFGLNTPHNQTNESTKNTMKTTTNESNKCYEDQWEKTNNVKVVFYQKNIGEIHTCWIVPWARFVFYAQKILE